MNSPKKLLILTMLLQLTACQSTPKYIVEMKPYTAPVVVSDERILKNANFSDEAIGYLLYDPVLKKVLVEKNSNHAFVPASVSKILTSVAALKILGPDYRFHTDLRIDGVIKNGVLNGNLYLKGFGDPYLLAVHLASFAKAVRDAGITKIAGQLIYDQSFFFSKPEILENTDLDGTWNAGISALSSEFNRAVIHWKYLENNTTEIFTTPDLPLVEGLRPAPEAAATGSENLPVREGAKYSAQLFKYFCEMNGIKTPEPTEGLAQGKLFKSLKSPPLLELTKLMLENSNNHMAELIAIATARKLGDSVSDFESVSGSILTWWKKQLPKVQWQGFSFHNGSGLTRENRFSPKQLTSILEYSYNLNFNGMPFYTLLPIGGWTGTLSKRLLEPPTALRVWAKTGTMDYANALSGYLFSKSGKPLIFSIFVTDFNERTKMQNDKLKKEKWFSAARELEDSLVKNWAILF